MSRPVLLTLALILTMALPLPPAAQAEEYRLGPSDRVELRIVDWNAASNELRDWPALNGAYTIGVDGTLAIPFAGTVLAENRTTNELGEEIASGIQSGLGLPIAPSVSVQVVEYRPIFVTGLVRNAGAYPFQPGLTVLKAISLAGGPPLPREGSSTDRNFITASGDLALHSAKRARQLAAKARIEAEIAGRDSIEPPAEADEIPEMETFLADEEAFLKARRARLDRQLEANRDLQDLLTAEIDSLTQQQQAQQESIALLEEQLGHLSDLAEKGLARSPDVRALRQSLLDAESELLELQTAMLRARQQLSRAEQDAAVLQTDHVAEVAEEKQVVEAELEALALRSRTSSQLVTEAIAAGTRETSDVVSIQYAIVREGENGAEEFIADQNTGLRPGDVVRATAVTAEGY